MRLTGASIAAQCAMEGSLLDQRAQIELEESIELVQKNRSFGLSAYCLRADSLEKCPGPPICTIKDQTQGSDLSMSTNVLEPLQRVLGTYSLFDIFFSETKR